MKINIHSRKFLILFIFGLIGSISEPATAKKSTPQAVWNFNEGHGDIARDATGNGHTAKIFGATWVKQSDGFALSLDGLDDYIELTATRNLAITGPITIEAWIKPMAKSQGLASLFAGSLSSYMVGYYAHAELVFWFIGSGGNKVADHVNLRQWNHIAATFDGNHMNLWLNGRLAHRPYPSKESKFKTFETDGAMTVGTKGRPDLPKFRGVIDNVRVYDHALPGAQVVAHYRNEAQAYGINPTWFRRVRLSGYNYLELGEVILEVNFQGLTPLQGKGRLEVELTSVLQPNDILYRKVIEPIPTSHARIGVIDVRVPVANLDPDNYLISIRLQDDHGEFPLEQHLFSYPAKAAALASPQEATVPPLPQPGRQTPFRISLGKHGGFTLTMKGKSFPFSTRVSWPHGDFNHLSPADATGGSEKSWKVKVHPRRHLPPTAPPGDKRIQYQVNAGGKYYKLRRNMVVHSTHIQIEDTYTNTTDEDLGLLIYNELQINPDQVHESRLGGFERGGRLENVFGPSVFLADKNTGIGFLPVDDVFVIQSVIYSDVDGWGIGTERFALAPGSSHTFEWAVYPTGSGDYYDFINNFRKVENRIGTIDGGLGFFTSGAGRYSHIPEADYFESRGLKYGLMHNLAKIVDDPTLSIQGVEFVDFPKERERLRRQRAAIRAKYPDLKVLVHIAHSLYCTNDTSRYPDSRVMRANGKQAIWGVTTGYISQEKQDAGWKFWIFYPTPGNSFHDVMMKSVDVLMDEIGIDGGFMDGFFAGYGGRWTYDGRWDGYSAEIDHQTKTINRKIGSVLLLSQPSMIEYCRKIRNKGGAIVANNTVVTRSLANERYIIHDSESGPGPQLHLAPTITALALGHSDTQKSTYLNTLQNLQWGELFIFYGGRSHDYAWRPLASRQFPMTFEEIRAGLVRGPQRIVTMNSGVYGWPGSRRLHMVYAYDARGGPLDHGFVTTINASEARTELQFSENESAVIEPIPITVETDTTTNCRVRQYDPGGINILLNGSGKVTLQIYTGPFAIQAGATYSVKINGTIRQVESRADSLAIAMTLDGQTNISISELQSTKDL